MYKEYKDDSINLVVKCPHCGSMWTAKMYTDLLLDINGKYFNIEQGGHCFKCNGKYDISKNSYRSDTFVSDKIFTCRGEKQF